MLLVLAVIAVPASANVSAERTLSATTITPGSNLEVIINIADYGDAAQVLEKIPSDFTFVSTTFPHCELMKGDDGDVLSFILLDETNLTYTVKAPASECQGKFLGLLRYNITDSFAIPNSTVNVKKSPRHSSGGGGGGGGGAGGSPEAQSNVEFKELSQAFVSNGNHVKFEFSKGVTCIKYVEFDALKTTGKITAIAEMLKGKSGLVSGLPSGTVYKNVNIWVGSSGFASPGNIENPAIGFRVEKAWLKEKGFDASDIAIWHYADGWKELETQKDGEDDDTYVYFKAKTSGFSPFVILAKGDAAQQIGKNSEILPSESVTEGANTPAKDLEKVPAAESENTSEDETPSGLPGFLAVLSVGMLGAVYCVLRRNP